MSTEQAIAEAEYDDREAIHWGPLSGVVLALLGLVGLAASFTLAVDKIKLLQDPDYLPSCNFNPVLSCGSVMSTEQAEVFGLPNPLLGLMGFAVIITLGVVISAGVRLPTPIMLGAAAGSLLGVVFVHWLIFESLYRIGALCPWCMVVWAVTVPIALWFTLKAADQCGPDGVRRVVGALWSWRFTLLALWYLGVSMLILVRFWDYWSTLI